MCLFTGVLNYHGLMNEAVADKRCLRRRLLIGRAASKAVLYERSHNVKKRLNQFICPVVYSVCYRIILATYYVVDCPNILVNLQRTALLLSPFGTLNGTTDPRWMKAELSEVHTHCCIAECCFVLVALVFFPCKLASKSAVRTKPQIIIRCSLTKNVI